MRKSLYKSTRAGFSALFLLATIAVLSACGDTTPQAPVISKTGGALAAKIQLLVGSQQVASYDKASTTVMAVVQDADGQTLPGTIVTFSHGGDSTAYFTDLVSIADANGIASATLNIGSDMANRVINVTATADTVTGSNTVAVTGTKIAISGNTSLAQSASTTLTILVKDSTGVAVGGVPLTVTSQIGNTIALTPATGVTDVTGQITAVVTATAIGADVLTVTGAGATQTIALNVNSASFTFTAPVTVPPATTPEIQVNTATPVTVHWTNAGAPSVGTAVYFTTSRGTFDAPGWVITDASGNATLNVTAGSTGNTIITATGGAGTGAPAATLNVVFVTDTASTITAQASPGTLGVNTAGSTTNQSVITVIVRDANNNLVKNAKVTFAQFADPSGGSLASSVATTDVTGTASVNYIAGSTSSGQNKVQIDAVVDSVNGVTIPQITASVFLTVASQSLFVRLGTDNQVYYDDPVLGVHTKQYTALVSDSAGNPAPDGTEVRFVLRPSKSPYWSFAKGRYTWVTTVWVRTVTATCLNEDLNWDGLLDPGEDMNVNGRLDPLGVATVNAKAITVGGFAIARISYPKDHAYWVQNDLEARAGTIGNDPPSVASVILPGLASDYANANSPPPGEISPFGEGAGANAVCTNPF